MGVDNQVKCEDEPIHLIGRIQKFGRLLVVNDDHQIVGLSANWDSQIGMASAKMIGEPVDRFIDILNLEDREEIKNLAMLVRQSSVRNVVESFLSGEPVYVRCYSTNNLLYIEFEDRIENQRNLSNLSRYTKELNESKEKIWEMLTVKIREVVHYDRVMIYRFLDDNSGEVIAESKQEHMSSYNGFRFPEFDIPQQARELYKHHHVRQTTGIHEDTVPILSDKNTSFDLSICNSRALSPIHLKYLENAGAEASLSFSIIVEDQLWGLVACQNEKPVYVDYNQRVIGLFLTQFAVNKHINYIKKDEIAFEADLSKLESNLKEVSLLKNNIVNGIAGAIPDISRLVNAELVAVVNAERIVNNERYLSNGQLLEIHKYINEYLPKGGVADHKFRLKYGDQFDFELPFAGLMRVDLDYTGKFSIYAFRKEQVFEVKWAGNPEKLMKYDPTIEKYVPSPRSSFQSWKQEVKGTSPQWSRTDLLCFERIKDIVKDTKALRSEEIDSLNEELIQLNNALDTYSYTVTHDLKNPLSAIKLTSQFLKQRLGTENLTVAKATDNILDAVQAMEDMMAKILQFSRSKVYQFSSEWVELDGIVDQIITTTTMQYGLKRSSVNIERLLPVYGEKTLLTQVFTNVISNALKYSSKQQKPIVKITSKIVDDQIEYTIEDNGIGIDSDELNSIFEAFKRMSNSSGYEGTGVGLSIVKRIMERLNGDIFINSVLDEGTTVRLIFPNANIPLNVFPEENLTA